MSRLSKGKLIVIEGIDGSGKTTQYNLLVERLKKEGRKVKHIHFPRHNTPFFGNMVDEYLRGGFGDPTKIHSKLASLVYACDRLEVKEKMNAWLLNGFDIVLDRYATSNAGHQLGKIQSLKDKLSYLKWLDTLEYVIFKIPKPDRVLYLHMPVEHVQNLMKNRKSKDLHETNYHHLAKAQQAYQFTVRKYPYWVQIPCVRGKRILGKDEIHASVWKHIKKILTFN